MGSKFGDAFAFLGKAAIGQMTGQDILGEELQHRMDAAKAAITGTSDLQKQVMESVSSTFDHINEFIEGCNAQGIRFHVEFKVDESIDDLESIRQNFWDEAKKSNEIFKANRNYAELLEITETNLIPKAEQYASQAQMFAHNLRAPALVAEHIDRVVNIGDEIEFFINSDKARTLKNINEIERQGNNVLNTVKDLKSRMQNLFEIYKPFEDYETEVWQQEFKVALGQLENEYKKFNMVSSGSSVAAQEMSEQQNPIEKIKSLGELLDLGLITQKDFEEKKAKLLKEI